MQGPYVGGGWFARRWRRVVQVIIGSPTSAVEITIQQLDDWYYTQSGAINSLNSWAEMIEGKSHSSEPPIIAFREIPPTTRKPRETN